MKVHRPWAFQGSLRRRDYFEGWYFKHVSADLTQVWSFIPGISLSKGKRHAFIQVINGMTEALKVPVRGSMSRTIKETVDATLDLTLRDRSGNILFHDQGKRAGMELIEKILEYF